MVVLGGMTSLLGSVLGAFFLTVLPEFLRVFENVEVLLFGLILVLCMLYLPGGLAGGLAALTERLRRTALERTRSREAADD
jgi:ABC-type branched-chain amino acid transport system, permease component